MGLTPTTHLQSETQTKVFQEGYISYNKNKSRNVYVEKAHFPWKWLEMRGSITILLWQTNKTNKLGFDFYNLLPWEKNVNVSTALISQNLNRASLFFSTKPAPTIQKWFIPTRVLGIPWCIQYVKLNPSQQNITFFTTEHKTISHYLNHITPTPIDMPISVCRWKQCKTDFRELSMW